MAAIKLNAKRRFFFLVHSTYYFTSTMSSVKQTFKAIPSPYYISNRVTHNQLMHYKYNDFKKVLIKSLAIVD